MLFRSNTSGGTHRLGGEPLRKNYAGIGYLYMKDIDAFVPPKPFNSWILEPNTGAWIAPVPRPDDGKYYIWNENLITWIESESILPTGEQQ